MQRRFAIALSLLVASCGGRTSLWLFPPEPAPDVPVTDAAAGEPFESGVRADASIPVADAGRADVASDAGPALDTGAVDAAADASAPDVVIVPGPVSCANPLGLQPGSPWPIARRCSARAGYTAAVGPSNPKVLWQREVYGGDLVVAADGTLYTYEYPHEVLALGPDGSTRWTANLPEPDAGTPADWSETSFAIGSDGTLYAWNGTLTALRPDGSQLWSLPVSSSDYTPQGIAVANDGSLLVLDTSGPEGALTGTLYCIDTSGHVRWQRDLGPGYGAASPVSVGSNGAIYVDVATVLQGGRYRSHVEAFTADGDLAWTGEDLGFASYAPLAIGDDGTVYVPCIVGVCPFTAGGQPLPEFTSVNNPGGPVLALAPAQGATYAQDGYSVRVFAPDGAVQWTYASGAGPVVVGNIVDGIGNVYAVATQPWGATAALAPDGGVLWQQEGGSCQAMGGDGTLYCIDYNTGPRQVLRALR